MPNTLTRWKRDDFGQYATGAEYRYYVHRQGRRYLLEVCKTIETAGIRTVKPGAVPVLKDWHDTAALAKATAAAYEAHADLTDRGARLRAAINEAYAVETGA